MADDLQSIPEPVADTRREQLAAALDAAPQGETAQPVAAPEPEPEPTEDRPRGEDGKFVAKEPTTAEPEPTPEPAAEPPVWARPPASWKKDFHEVWATAANDPKLSPLVEYAYRREEEMRAGIEPLIPKAKFADQVNEAMAPFQENIKASGVEPVQALQSLMVADHQLRSLPVEQKAAYGLSLLTQYGVPLEAIYAALASPPPQVPAGYMPVQNVQNLVKQEMTAWQAQQEDQLLQQEIEQFKADKPDFEDLKPAMQALLANGLVPDLATAYQKAKRLDDTSFTAMQTAHNAEAEAKKRAAADQAAKSARAAAVSARSSSPGAQAPTKAQDRRSLLASQIDELGGSF